MTDNEKFAIKQFEYEMHKAKCNMLNILRNSVHMSESEFSRKMRAELAQYDGSRMARDYYSRDINAIMEVCNVSNK